MQRKEPNFYILTDYLDDFEDKAPSDPAVSEQCQSEPGSFGSFEPDAADDGLLIPVNQDQQPNATTILNQPVVLFQAAVIPQQLEEKTKIQVGTHRKP